MEKDDIVGIIFLTFSFLMFIIVIGNSTLKDKAENKWCVENGYELYEDAYFASHNKYECRDWDAENGTYIQVNCHGFFYFKCSGERYGRP